MSFNYVDAFNSSSQLEYKSKQHDASVEIQGRRCYVFLLDRKKTEVSEVYNEAIKIMNLTNNKCCYIRY